MTRPGAVLRRATTAAGLAALLAAVPVAAAEVPQIRRGDLVAGTGVLPDPAAAAASGRRYAIVVGNGDYRFTRDLPNARADAGLVAAFLRASGFHVVARTDLDRRGFEALLRQALFEIEPDSEVVFYYAGHGFQIGRHNYLVPVDADLSETRDLAFDTVTLDSLVAILGARSRMQVIILDSCRDNPFAYRTAIAGLTSEPQPTETGFSPMAAPLNTLIAFSTAPGAVALDGSGANSPYTGALVALASRDAGAAVTALLAEVRREVYRATGGRQVPWESSTLVETFRFARAPAPVPEAGGDPVPGEGPSAFRSLSTSEAAAAALPPTLPAALGAADAALEAPLDRRILVGAALVAALGLDPGTSLAVRPAFGIGRLVLRGPDGVWADLGDRPVPAGALGDLAFEPDPRQEPAGPARDAHVLHEILAVRLADGTQRRVALTLVPTECDFLAGDHLDPEGIGITRYPNEIAPEEARAACEAAWAAAPGTGRFAYQLGRALVALRDHDRAREVFERARDLGHTRAWYALGQLEGARAALTGGRDDAAADEAAFPYYFEGVRRGDPYAYHALGKQLLRYSGNSELQGIGFDLLTRAIEVGHTFAMNELGAFFLDAASDHYEPARGLRYWRESALRGDIYGFDNLGRVHDQGLAGVAPDAAAAAEWYRRAAEGGHPTAPRRLARLYQAGRIGTAPDPVAALRWYDVGLMRGDGLAGAEAAWLIATGPVPGTDLPDAALRAARAATLRNARARADAMDLLGQMPGEALAAATARLLAELGATGADPLVRIAAEEGQAVPATALDRLLFLAATAWKRSRFRVDLY